MPGGLDFGDLPTWLTVATPAAVAALEGRRRERVAKLGRRIEELVASAEELGSRVLEHDELEELVIRAVENAARTTWQEKLDALASVVAAAVDGDDTVVSTSLLVEAALSRLERPHAQALTQIAEHGPATRHELVARWAGATGVLDALVAVLAGEGFIRNIASGTYDGVEGREKWVISELGEELLFLLRPHGDTSSPAAGKVVVTLDDHHVVVANQGLVTLRLSEVKMTGGNATATLVPTEAHPAGLPLAAGERLSARFMMIPPGAAVVEVDWADRHGPQHEAFNVVVR